MSIETTVICDVSATICHPLMLMQNLWSMSCIFMPPRFADHKAHLSAGWTIGGCVGGNALLVQWSISRVTTARHSKPPSMIRTWTLPRSQQSPPPPQPPSSASCERPARSPIVVTGAKEARKSEILCGLSPAQILNHCALFVYCDHFTSIHFHRPFPTPAAAPPQCKATALELWPMVLLPRNSVAGALSMMPHDDQCLVRTKRSARQS